MKKPTCLLFAACTLCLLSTPARADLRVTDPDVRAALQEFEQYASKPNTASNTREKKSSATLPAVLGSVIPATAATSSRKVARE